MQVILNEYLPRLCAMSPRRYRSFSLGDVMANAGIDRSTRSATARAVLLLLRFLNASAAALRDQLAAHFGIAPAVIVSDSFGRAWRVVPAALPWAPPAWPALRDKRGHPDLYGRALRVTEIGYADEIAAAASRRPPTARPTKRCLPSWCVAYCGLRPLFLRASLTGAADEDLFCSCAPI